MYFSPVEGVAVDCGIPLPMERWESLNRLAELDGIDLNDFLPHDIFDLCTDIMSRFEGEIQPDAQRPFLPQYLFLRNELKQHRGAKASPALSTLERPTGGWKAFAEKMQAQGVDIAAEMEQYEGPESDYEDGAVDDNDEDGQDEEDVNFDSGEDLEFPV